MTGPEQHAATVRAFIGTFPAGTVGEEMRSPAHAALDELVALAGRADELEGELAEVAVAPDSWKDENGHLRGYQQGDDPRDALDRLGFIYGSLKGEKQPARSVALEAMRLAESQVDRAEAAEARADELQRERDERPTLEEAMKNVNYWKDKEYEARREADQARALGAVQEKWAKSEHKAADRLRELLRRWADRAMYAPHTNADSVLEDTRAALAEAGFSEAFIDLAGVQAEEQTT